MEFEVLLFDIGNTLISGNFVDGLTFISNKVSNNVIEKEKIKEIFRGNFVKAKNEEFRPLIDIFKDTLKQTIGLEIGITQIRKGFKQYIEQENIIFPEVKETLVHLKNKGYTLGIISNTDSDFMMMQLKKFSLLPFFSILVSSEEARCYKPDKKIFEMAIKKSDCHPSKILFIGNSDKDIIGAESVGLKTVLISNSGKTEQKPDYLISSLKDIEKII